VKLLARVVAIAGVASVAWMLLGGGPRDVVLVYDVSAVPGARALDVEVVRGGEILRRAEFRLGGRDGRVTHALRLPDGDYVVRGRIEAPGGATSFERRIEVHEAGTIVLALGS
jgi:hypothetical protein